MDGGTDKVESTVAQHATKTSPVSKRVDASKSKHNEKLTNWKPKDLF